MEKQELIKLKIKTIIGGCPYLFKDTQMKYAKIIPVILMVFLVVVFGYIAKRTIWGYQRSRFAHSFGDIKELNTIGLRKIFEVNELGNTIEYHIKTGYEGRGYISILLKYQTNEKDFVNMVFYGLEHDQIENNVWHGKHDNEFGTVEKIGDMTDKEAYLFRIKEQIYRYTKDRDLVNSIDGQDLCGFRTIETSNRYASITVIYGTRTNIAIVIIQSSFK